MSKAQRDQLLELEEARFDLEQEKRIAERLRVLKHENHMTAAAAARECQTGPAAARREELLPCAAWHQWPKAAVVTPKCRKIA